MLMRLGKAHYPAGVIASVKGVGSLVLGLAIGHGLLWGMGFLGYALREKMLSQPYEDRVFLGALLLALALGALILAAIALGLRRPSGWFTAFLLGAAASAPLVAFGFLFLMPEWSGD